MAGFRNILQPRSALTIVPANDAGADRTIDLANGVQTYKLWVTITATLTIAVAATKVINRGSLASCFKFALLENGTDRVRSEGRALRFIAECFSPSAVTSSRLTAVAPAAYVLTERFPVYFASPYAINPGESAFLEANTQERLQFAAQLKSATPEQFLITGGTATLGNITVRVSQEFVADRAALPFFRPTIREVVKTISAANAAEEIRLDIGNRVRGLLIMQDTNVGQVGDIINAIALRGDGGTDLIGPQLQNFTDLVEMQEGEFGGAVFPSTGANDLAATQNANLFLHFQKYGRLSSLLNPSADYKNLRFVADVQPSVAAGVTTSQVRVTILEMERPAPIGARKLVTDVLPPSLV